MLLSVETAFEHGQTIKLRVFGDVVIPVVVEQIEVRSTAQKTEVYYHLRTEKKYTDKGKEDYNHYGPTEESYLLPFQSLEYGVQK